MSLSKHMHELVHLTFDKQQFFNDNSSSHPAVDGNGYIADWGIKKYLIGDSYQFSKEVIKLKDMHNKLLIASSLFQYDGIMGDETPHGLIANKSNSALIRLDTVGAKYGTFTAACVSRAYIYFIPLTPGVDIIRRYFTGKADGNKVSVSDFSHQVTLQYTYCPVKKKPLLIETSRINQVAASNSSGVWE